MLEDMQNNLDSHPQTLGDLPFEQKELNGRLLRTFSSDVDDEELKWHQDLKDREVTIIESNGWMFQLEDSLPTKLFANQKLHIPKFVWHRVIKGDGDLKVSILEFD